MKNINLQNLSTDAHLIYDLCHKLPKNSFYVTSNENKCLIDNTDFRCLKAIEDGMFELKNNGNISSFSIKKINDSKYEFTFVC